MKHTIIVAVLALTLCLSAGPCQLTPGELSQEQMTWYTTKINQIEAAEAAGDFETADAIRMDVEPFENMVIMRRADPITKVVGAMYPPAAPFIPMLPGFLTWLGFPLVGKRGRQNFTRSIRAGADALKAVLPGVKYSDGTRKPQAALAAKLAGVAVKSALAYLGPMHSSSASKAAFEGEGKQTAA